ncbi:MAG: hypothetical protein H7Y06_09135 [Opitutaceae bacterium]|nr:hypothetical protein [Opitutaceae bacterium]
MLATGVSAAPPKAKTALPFPYARMGVANGCFVESVALGDALRARLGGETWYRILQWGAKEDEEAVAGHAVLVFQHLGKLWNYDINYGLNALETPVENRDNVDAVAKEATAPYMGKITPRFPLYREDFAQAADPKPPAEFTGVEESELRDAGLVAGRLAKHRPVALLEFTYPKDGVTRRGAAAAFVHSGRLCVYTATNGTVPFRVRALNVDNLRQLQELLRRIYPGVSALTAR